MDSCAYSLYRLLSPFAQDHSRQVTSASVLWRFQSVDNGLWHLCFLLNAPLFMSPPDAETKLPFSLLGTLLVRANEGRTLFRGAHSIAILLDGKQTGEKFTTLLVTSPPGGGPGPHYHDREDEWFYIVEGRVSFFMNGTWTDLFPGDCVYSPRGSIHGFINNTDQPIRVFINFTPAGIEGLFVEAAKEWAQPEPDMNRLRALDEKYGLHSM
jgi:quercetin dioxygenase-like cupin family protein